MKVIINIIILNLIGISTLLSQDIKTLHDFSVKTLYGEEYDFSNLKGKKVLVVNTASKCGLTPQYEKLQELYKQHKNSGFEIIAFPANNFKNQEPGTNEEIASFCEINYNITFPIMEKISVKGDDIHPVYKWLTMKSQNGVLDAKVTWNFQKFMIDENGNLVDFLAPTTSPLSKKIVNWIVE